MEYVPVWLLIEVRCKSTISMGEISPLNFPVFFFLCFTPLSHKNRLSRPPYVPVVLAWTRARHGILNKTPIALVAPGADNGGGGWDALASWVVLGGGFDMIKKEDFMQIKFHKKTAYGVI